MTIDFLIGAVRASDLHPLVKTELEEVLIRRTCGTEQDAMNVLKESGWIECDFNCVPFAMIKAKIGGLET